MKLWLRRRAKKVAIRVECAGCKTSYEISCTELADLIMKDVSGPRATLDLPKDCTCIRPTTLNFIGGDGLR